MSERPAAVALGSPGDPLGLSKRLLSSPVVSLLCTKPGNRSCTAYKSQLLVCVSAKNPPPSFRTSSGMNRPVSLDRRRISDTFGLVMILVIISNYDE